MSDRTRTRKPVSISQTKPLDKSFLKIWSVGLFSNQRMVVWGFWGRDQDLDNAFVSCIFFWKTLLSESRVRSGRLHQAHASRISRGSTHRAWGIEAEAGTARQKGENVG